MSEIDQRHLEEVLVGTLIASRYIRVLAMTWYDRRGWVTHTFNKNGTVTKRDLRKTNEKKDDTK